MEPKLQSTNVSTKTETKTETDGTVIKTVTTTTIEKYSDGSTRTKVSTKIKKTPPGAVDPSVYEVGYDPLKSSAPKVKVTTAHDFIELCLQEHNKYRAKHHVPALVINRELCKIAQAWANTNAKEDRMYHSGLEFGENLYWSNMDYNGDRPVQRWYSEIKDYDWKINDSHKGTGHFTQVLWKRSKELGVAIATSKSGKIYVVAEYNPPGNFEGRYIENVLPEK